MENDKARLTALVKASIDSRDRRTLSPFYQLLHALTEPDWHSLLLDQPNEFGDARTAWRSRVDAARQKNLPGDILVLADETPTRPLWLEAKHGAAHTLLKQYNFALEQYQEALAVRPTILRPVEEKSSAWRS